MGRSQSSISDGRRTETRLLGRPARHEAPQCPQFRLSLPLGDARIARQPVHPPQADALQSFWQTHLQADPHISGCLYGVNVNLFPSNR